MNTVHPQTNLSRPPSRSLTAVVPQSCRRCGADVLLFVFRQFFLTSSSLLPFFEEELRKKCGKTEGEGTVFQGRSGGVWGKLAKIYENIGKLAKVGES